jgi:hypothetical protein
MLVVPLVFSPPADNNPRHNAMDFKPGTGVLFGSLNDGVGGLPENHLSTIDTTTGVVTVLGPTQDGLDALAFTSVSDFDVSASPASQTVARGQAATYTASVNPIFSTFNNPVSLACGSLPTGVSYSFSPGTVTPGASPANSTLTVDTSGLATLGAPPFGRPEQVPLYALWLGLPGLAVVGVALFGQAAKRGQLVFYLSFTLLLAGLTLLAACGGKKAPPPPPITFTIPITGTSGSLVRSTTVTLTAQ